MDLPSPLLLPAVGAGDPSELFGFAILSIAMDCIWQTFSACSVLDQVLCNGLHVGEVGVLQMDVVQVVRWQVMVFWKRVVLRGCLRIMKNCGRWLSVLLSLKPRFSSAMWR